MAEVTIYSRRLCGYCNAAKRLLSSKNVEFTEHDATFNPELRAEMIAKSMGRTTFPQIFINGTLIGGFDELNALERSGRLDPLLLEEAAD